MRLTGLTVHAQCVIDDGTNLTPINTEPVFVTAEDWPTYPAKLRREMAQLERDFEAQQAAQPRRARRAAKKKG